MIPVAHRLGLIYLALAALVFVAGGAASLGVRAKTVTRIQHVHATYAAGTPAEVVAAWGKPDSQVDGAQVNQALAGTTCAIYQSKRAIICY